MSVRHWDFIAESLVELRENLKRCGQPLVVRTGDVVDVLDELRAGGFISGLWSHQETGNNWTYQRDLKVGAWCREHNIKWHEIQNHGVSRPSRSRNGWSKRWDGHMGEEVAKPPNLPAVNIDLGTIPTSSTMAITEGFCPVRQSGGSSAAMNLLESFLSERGETYRTSMSSPLSAEIACSRLSPHISWGTISMRQVNLAAKSRQIALKNSQPGSMVWRQSQNLSIADCIGTAILFRNLKTNPKLNLKTCTQVMMESGKLGRTETLSRLGQRVRQGYHLLTPVCGI